MFDELDLLAHANYMADYDLADWQGPTGDCTAMRAAIVMARAWRAELDPTPTDEAWLRSVGFQEHERDANGSLYSRQNNYDCQIRAHKGFDEEMKRLSLDSPWFTYGQVSCLESEYLPTGTTRGQLRTLCRALGIVLDEGK